MDRVSTHGPFITKERAAELGVLQSSVGYEKKEDGTWKALDPADKPTEQSATAVPAPSQPTHNNVRVEEKDGVITTVDPKGNRQTFTDGDAWKNYMDSVLGEGFTLTRKKNGVWRAKRRK